MNSMLKSFKELFMFNQSSCLFCCFFCSNSKSVQELNNSRLCLFSYGSGLAASMFSVIVSENARNRFSLEKIHQNLGKQKLQLVENRVEIEPQLYDKYLYQRETWHKKAPRSTNLLPDSLFPGTWYFKSIDEKYRRSYERTELSSKAFNSRDVREYLINELNNIS